jgi:hypothetical protein
VITESLPPPNTHYEFYRGAFKAALSGENYAALDGFAAIDGLLPCLLHPQTESVSSILSLLSLVPPPHRTSSYCSLILSLVDTTLAPVTDESIDTLMTLVSSLHASVLFGIKEDVKATVSNLPPSVQRDYVVQILNSADGNDRTKPPKLQPTESAAVYKAPKPTTQTPQSMLQLQLATLSPLFPSHGTGYLQLALLCYGNDVTATSDALLGSDTRLHPRLRGVPIDLPAMKQRDNSSYDQDGVAADFKDLQKSVLKKIDAEEENAAFLKSMYEYDDDYDDQYDDPHSASGVDVASLADIGAMKEYNRHARESMQADAEWEGMRNTNVKKARAAGEKEKLWEATAKGKKGRPIRRVIEADKTGDKNDGEDGDASEEEDGKLEVRKPQPRPQQQGNQGAGAKGAGAKGAGAKGAGAKNSGEKGVGEKSTGEKSTGEMTDLQKKRKDKNKAQRANHNRKDRALKKTGGAM